jgi:hypothetical protein
MHVFVLLKLLAFARLKFVDTAAYITDFTWVLHNKKWNYYTTITIDNDFFFTALKVTDIHPSIHPMALQPESDPGLP